MRPNRYIALILVAAAIGFVFASVSTRDFAMHLDRQVHDVTCSFTPGLSGPETGESGCLVTMVSPYSSVLRSVVWGGIPIALPGMALFAFLFAFAAEMVVSKRQDNRRAAALMALATAVPLATSMVMATISFFELDAVCKLCVGIYVSSLLCFAGGLGLYLKLRKGAAAPPAGRKPVAKKREKEEQSRGQEPAFTSAKDVDGDDEEDVDAEDVDKEDVDEEEPERGVLPAPVVLPLGGRYVASVLAAGLLFVAVPTVGYVAAAPDHSRFIGTCGSLSEPADPELLIPLGPTGGVPAIEILDPLCPACRQFEERITESGFDEQLSRSAILFPLDDTCNWMVDKAMHPGACTVSRAILCAGPRAAEVLDWAFDEQDTIIAATKKDPAAAGTMVSKRFPEFASCLESPEIEAKLNRSLRWAVSNQIRVLTPQLFVGGVKLCDEDVDIGLAFAMSEMIERHKAGTLQAVEGEPVLEAVPEAEPVPVPVPEAKPEAKPEPVPETETETETEAEAKPETDSEAKPETEPVPVPVPEAEAKPEPVPEPVPEAEAKPEPAPVPVPEAKPEPKPAPEPAIDTAPASPEPQPEETP